MESFSRELLHPSKKRKGNTSGPTSHSEHKTTTTQFTVEYATDHIPLLDILVKLNIKRIWMDLYQLMIMDAADAKRHLYLLL